MNRRTRRALKRIESQRFSSRCKDASDSTLKLAEAIAICDEILDEQEGITYEESRWERIKRIFRRAA